jgi:integrase
VVWGLREQRVPVNLEQPTRSLVACPIDEMKPPAVPRTPRCGSHDRNRGRRPFAGWREELATCRRFAPTARNYAAACWMSEVGLRINDACRLDLDNIKWDFGRFGKLHVCRGKGSRAVGRVSGWRH